MKRFKISEKQLAQQLNYLENHISLHDYGEVIKHLLNEVAELKKEIILVKHNSALDKR